MIKRYFHEFMLRFCRSEPYLVTMSSKLNLLLYAWCMGLSSLKRFWEKMNLKVLEFNIELDLRSKYYDKRKSGFIKISLRNMGNCWGINRSKLCGIIYTRSKMKMLDYFSYLAYGQMRTGKDVYFVYDCKIKVGQWTDFKNSWNHKCQLISRKKLKNGVWIKNKMKILTKTNSKSLKTLFFL